MNVSEALNDTARTMHVDIWMLYGPRGALLRPWLGEQHSSTKHDNRCSPNHGRNSAMTHNL
ncbi:MAG: hypothetical protein LC808_20905, partial [Actinobacteria bacterium]|nr:hypothetical protein [Actinomycetota bacterium]